MIKNNLKSYYDAFDTCNDIRNKGEITSFILMFLDLLEEASNDLFNKLHDLKDRLKELDDEDYILTAKYGKRIGYTANLSKIDELKETITFNK